MEDKQKNVDYTKEEINRKLDEFAKDNEDDVKQALAKTEKQVKKEEKKKKRKKTAIKVLLIVLAVILAFIVITSIITSIGLKANIKKAHSFKSVAYENGLPKFENYSSGCWNITSDREIKVMQLTDVHLGGGWMSIKKDSMAMNAVASMVSTEKPDFVVVTGDVSYPVPFQAGTFNNKNGAKLFAELMESLGVYWTLCYGNHDTEAYSYYSREDLTEFYSSGEYPHCLVQEGPTDVDGCGNQIINFVNADGVIIRTFVMFDSHSYVDGDYFGIAWKYDNIHENQVAWYKNQISSLSVKNADRINSLPAEKQAQYQDLKTVKSSAFMHIPLTEYKDAWKEYQANGYKDTANVKYNYGRVGESGEQVYCGIKSDDLFETMQLLGSTDSVFCGHDHLNNFSLNYKGINLNYGMSIDYLAYSGISKIGSQRGCTILNIAADGTLTSRLENYYQDKYLSQYAKEAVTMQTLGDEAQNAN